MISSDGTVILTQEEYDEMYEESCHAYLTVLKKDKEISEMKKRLEIATKALNDIVKDYDRNGSCEEDCVGEYMCGTAIKALKEMEGIQ